MAQQQATDMEYDSFDAVLHWIFRSTLGDSWFKPTEENISAGVCLRVAPGHFRAFPYENNYLAPFASAVAQLNPLVAVKVRTAAVHSALAVATLPGVGEYNVAPGSEIKEGQEPDAIYVDKDTRIQILESMAYLPRADKEQGAAFLRDERVLIVWSDELDHIVPLCSELEEKMMKLVWRSRHSVMSSPSPSLIGGAIPVNGVAPTVKATSPSILTTGSTGSAISMPSSTANLVLASGNGKGKGRAREGSLLGGSTAPPSSFPSAVPSNATSAINLAQAPSARPVEAAAVNAALSEKTPAIDEEKAAAAAAANDSDKKTEKRSWWFLSKKKESQKVTEKGGDPEKAELVKEPRPIRLFAPLYGGLGVALAIFFVGSGVNTLLSEWQLDRDATRFALLAAAPFLVCVSLFFTLQIITTLAMIIGPIAQYHENSKYYSANRPQPNPAVDRRLPHITVEMPVYKESLEETIAPSVFSLKKAMQTYARQGGTSSILIHDDGLQSLPAIEKEKRINFYSDHNIGWIARPAHDNAPDGYKRAGRFKKASNMNYGLQLSLCMEKHIIELEGRGYHGVIPLEDLALERAIEETHEANGKRWRPWARNARSLRIGDIILIVDSDTVVPEDCFRDAARELAECPDVAIIQHESDVMQVAHHFFENGIAHFTRRINKCISLACANGEVAPFVGHNAFLRWSALQDAAFVDPADGVKKIWSESNVSEDFDMALRLQLKGYGIRWANYSEGGFKEGVSLTVDDELNRWQKYSYGCSELIFYPLKDWWRKGPINKQLRTFLWSNAPVHYKVSMLSYMFSYYGIAAAALLSLLNYLLLGWAFDVDGYFMHSFEIFLACTVVFPGAGNVAYTLLEYRLGKRDIFSGALENFSYVPFFFFFFAGLSVHLSIALLAHMFSYNITWGATVKEVQKSNFWIEGPRILKRYWFVFTLAFLALAAIVVLSTGLVPLGWQIKGTSWALYLPLVFVATGHILFPIVLNPWLIIFSY